MSHVEFRAFTDHHYHEIPLGGHIPGEMGTLSIHDNGKLLHEIKYLIVNSGEHKFPLVDHIAGYHFCSHGKIAYFTAKTDRIIVRSFGPYLNENSNVIQFEFPDADECYMFRFSELPVKK